MRFASLGSGSKGNATLVEADDVCILIDCGFSLKETEARLQRLKQAPENIKAIVLTHEHGDHVRGAGPLARKYKIPVWATRGTCAQAALGKLPVLNHIDVHQCFTAAGLEVQPFPVPHDAREPCQFAFSDGQRRLGLLTDTGTGTLHIEQQLSACQTLILECNHDTEMLANGPYPESLKQRVGGRLGHLSNTQAADLLARLDCSQLKHLVAAHLSEQNNTPQLAQQALSEALGCESEWIAVAKQDTGLDWREV